MKAAGWQLIHGVWKFPLHNVQCIKFQNDLGFFQSWSLAKSQSFMESQLRTTILEQQQAIVVNRKELHLVYIIFRLQIIH